MNTLYCGNQYFEDRSLDPAQPSFCRCVSQPIFGSIPRVRLEPTSLPWSLMLLTNAQAIKKDHLTARQVARIESNSILQVLDSHFIKCSLTVPLHKMFPYCSWTLYFYTVFLQYTLWSRQLIASTVDDAGKLMGHPLPSMYWQLVGWSF